MLRVETIQVGYIGTNCHIAYDDESKLAIIVDPGGEPGKIAKLITKLAVKPVSIVNTHGHLDHIGANDFLADKYVVPVHIHSADADMLTDSAKNLSGMFGNGFVCKPADKLLEHGDELILGDYVFRVIHTPGHTPGGCCLYTVGHLFSGDTLFKAAIGRTDFPGGSARTLTNSIKTGLFVLPADTVVYPGHEDNTTIGYEKRSNPFIF